MGLSSAVPAVEQRPDVPCAHARDWGDLAPGAQTRDQRMGGALDNGYERGGYQGEAVGWEFLGSREFAWSGHVHYHD